MSNIFTARPVKIEYTNGQRKALELVQEFLNQHEERFFLLAGYSGCGKTTIAENIAIYAKARILAPTNAAVNRLKEKITLSSDKFSTIHSEMYAPTDIKGFFKKNKGLISRTNYIIDEASMIDEFILNDLITEALEKNCKIIFMGDSFQLEPVGKDPHLFSWNHKEFNPKYQYELTEVKRYDGDLLKIATELRTKKECHFQAIDSDDLVILNKFSKQMINDFKNNESAIVLTSTNQTRITYNEKIRAVKYKQVENLMYAQNYDKLVSVSNNSHYSNGETFTMMHPMLIGEFNLVIEQPKTDELKSYDALFYTNNNGVPVLLIPHLLEPSLHGAQIIDAYENKYFNLPMHLHKALFIENKYKDKIWFNKNVVIATYGYAISCHKAQGQEWDNVYIDATWLSSAWNHARWFYTAITRAKKKVEVKENKYLKMN